MPLARLVCYCNGCKGERALDVDEALDHAAQRRGGRFTYELLRAMLAQVQDRGTRISTTTLSTKCLRSEVLQRTEPYTLDPAKGYASFRGTMFHGQLELHAHPESIEEPRFHIILPGGHSFSGAPDLVDPVYGYLYDYKFTSENPRFDSPWKEHRVQGQVNRWLVDNADYVEWRGEFYALTPDGAQELRDAYGDGGVNLHADVEANRKKFVPVDWQGIYVVYMDDKGPKPILCTKTIQVPKKTNPEETKSARVADIWTDEEVEEFVSQRYLKVREAFDRIATDPSDIPPIEDDFMYWKHPLCNWCAVKESCVQHFIEEQVVALSKTSRRAS